MLKIKTNCSACGACAQICPTSSIILESDHQGMVFPKIDEAKCVDCNLCEKVCHLNGAKLNVDTEQHAYAVSHPSKDVLNRSTSGGAFTAIAQYVLSKGGAVCGCAYTERLIARHIWVENEQDLIRLNGSKYVESAIGDTYQQAKNILDRGRLVFFTGTPCQIAGLKAFLRKQYENLITADIVCHGVAPQAFFQKYLDWFEDKHKICVMDYNFRSKQNSGWSIAGMAEGIHVGTGRNVEKKLFYFNEYYYYHFLKGTIYRDSCYSCQYASTTRPGDFSLGDLWGVECLKLDFPINNGCSLVLANNSKANSILDSLELHKTEISMSFAVKYNQQLQHASPKPVNRDDVLNRFISLPAKDINLWFRNTTGMLRLKSYLKHLMPYRIKKIILSLKYKA